MKKIRWLVAILLVGLILGETVTIARAEVEQNETKTNLNWLKAIQNYNEAVMAFSNIIGIGSVAVPTTF